MQLSCSDEKTPRRVRTSLEEKYAKLSKTASVVPSASANRTEDQQHAMEKQQNSLITVECVVVCTLLNNPIFSHFYSFVIPLIYSSSLNFLV